MDEECVICRHLESETELHEQSLYLGFALAVNSTSIDEDPGPLCQKHMDIIVPIMERLDS